MVNFRSINRVAKFAGKTPTRYADSELRMGNKLTSLALGDEFDPVAHRLKSASYANTRKKADAFKQKTGSRTLASEAVSANRRLYRTPSGTTMHSGQFKNSRGGQYAGQTPEPFKGAIPHPSTPSPQKYKSTRGSQYTGQTPEPFKGTIPGPPRGKHGSSRSSRYAGQTPRTANSLKQAQREATRRTRQTQVINGKYLNGVEGQETLFKSIGATGGTLGRSMYKNLSEKGAMGRAFKGTVQASAVSAAGSGGLAYLNGDDPWEAAKTGAIRGAMVGAGYQGLKAATHTTAAFGKGGLKQIGTGLKDTYGAHTVAGQSAIRNNGQMSNQLKRILMAGKDTRIAEEVLLR